MTSSVVVGVISPDESNEHNDAIVTRADEERAGSEVGASTRE